MFHARMRTWALSALLVVVGVAYLFLQEDPVAAILFALAGVLVPLVAPVVRPAQDGSGVPREGAAGLEGLAEMVAGLGVEGRGVHVPTEGGVRLFLPAENVRSQAELPRLDDGTVLIRNRPGTFGLAVTPPGQGRYATWVAGHGDPRGTGPEGAAATIRQALPELGLATDVRVESGKGRLRIQYRHLVHAELCRQTREQWAPWHVQGGCPVCSLVAMLATRAVDQPLRVEAMETAGDVTSSVLAGLPERRKTPAEGAEASVGPIAA